MRALRGPYLLSLKHRGDNNLLMIPEILKPRHPGRFGKSGKPFKDFASWWNDRRAKYPHQSMNIRHGRAKYYWEKHHRHKRYPDNIKIPFKPWWALFHKKYPNIPKDVAHQWIYHHTDGPYYWLDINNISFETQTFSAQFITRCKSSFFDYEKVPVQATQQGQYLEEINHHSYEWLEERNENVRRPIIFDNRNGTLSETYLTEHPQERTDPYPHDYLIIEGHMRLATLCYATTKRRVPNQTVWLLTLKEIKNVT